MDIASPAPNGEQLAARSTSKPEVRRIRPMPKPRRRSSSVRELDILIRARCPVVYVVSWEEERVERALREIAESLGRSLFVWTVTQGLVNAGVSASCGRSGAGKMTDPLSALDAVVEQIDASVFLFKDLHQYLNSDRGNASVVRRLRDAARQSRAPRSTIVICAPRRDFDPDLVRDVAVVEFGLPHREEFAESLDRIIRDAGDNPYARIELDAAAREALLQAAQGLTLREAEAAFVKAIIGDGRLDSRSVDVVNREKEHIVRRSGLLEFCQSREGFCRIAGLENLKHWLTTRSLAFGERARKWGLPTPRGILLAGVPGCGKSLVAKSLAGLWNLPLIKLDAGRIFGPLVGNSEENIRRAIETVESISPCVLWIDEIDKAFGGLTASTAGDGGTALRVLGTLLTWMSERASPVFLAATANSVDALPAELLRKGRFDEIFFIDLPHAAERMELFRIQLVRRGLDAEAYDLPRLAAAAAGFSGAEVENAIVSALYEAFAQQARPNTGQVLAALRETVPLSATMRDEIERLRSWAPGRARIANRPPESRCDRSGPTFEILTEHVP